MNQVELAERIARESHAGQLDKGGQPYIQHPQYVARQLSDPILKAAAWLHDVLEDTQLTETDLYDSGVCPKVISLVRTLTKLENEDYWHYLQLIKKNPDATQIKIEDLKHNLQIDRISNPSPDDILRIEKYQKALEYLLSPE